MANDLIASPEIAIAAQLTAEQLDNSRLGSTYLRSGMFGCTNQAQGEVFAHVVLKEGKKASELMARYHIINGQLSMRAEAMLADFIAIGGKHRIDCRTSDKAQVTLSIDGESYTESITWEEAQQEPYVYDKNKTLKRNWATPRARRQMMWARVISEAVRTLRPGIVVGTYTPEEVRDFSNNNGRSQVYTEGPAATVEHTHAPALTVDVVQKPQMLGGSTATGAGLLGSSTPEQHDKIRQLFESLGNITEDQRKNMLEKRGVQYLNQLSYEQADEIIVGLIEKVAGKPEPEPPLEKTVEYLDDPTNQETVDEIKNLVRHTNNPNTASTLQKFMVGRGKKLLDLTVKEAESLKRKLEINDLESWINEMSEEDVPFVSS